MTTIAIIGAGLAGLTVAKQLSPLAEVTIFEKARGVSGRLSTRRTDTYHFDHGAPFFKARSQEFKDFLQPLINGGIVQIWDARFAEIDRDQIVSERMWDEELPHYVGSPRMSAMTKHLSTGLNIHLATRVHTIHKATQSGKVQWHLTGEDNSDLGTFDWVISAAPAEQSAELIPTNIGFHQRIANTTMQGCYAIMLGFEPENLPVTLDFDAALIRNSRLSWMSVNHTKPGRPQHYALTVLSSNAWADEHIDTDQDWVRQQLLESTSDIIGCDANKANHIALHRWRYANVTKQEGESYLIDTEQHIAACGDWLIRGNVEAAFISGNDLAQKIIQELS